MWKRTQTEDCYMHRHQEYVCQWELLWTSLKASHNEVVLRGFLQNWMVYKPQVVTGGFLYLYALTWLVFHRLIIFSTLSNCRSTAIHFLSFWLCKAFNFSKKLSEKVVINVYPPSIVLGDLLILFAPGSHSIVCPYFVLSVSSLPTFIFFYKVL